ncbi:hypothetical protein RSSM_00044 [Rhodopirellula sallentina SM41]|uniref:Uncharacterized protein n=1 Tax=Rhodopirellula sallentina SM41 TaxID=1263870 RepID=M5UAQ6_9BACT|nr:hypothetical protein RSSM_00044 [Rhodopirellula sallentina SM41]
MNSVGRFERQIQQKNSPLSPWRLRLKMACGESGELCLHSSRR